MDFSKLDPRTWFRRAEAPKPIESNDPPAPPARRIDPKPLAPDHLPKFKAGQHCLVLKNVNEYKMGNEVVLEYLAGKFGGFKSDGTYLPVKAWAWVPVGAKISTHFGRETQTALREEYLMALDDPTVQEYLVNEMLDSVEQSMAKFARMSEQFDILAKALDEQLKPKRI